MDGEREEGRQDRRRRRIVDRCLLRSMNAWEIDTAVRNASQSERPTPLDDDIGRGTLLARAVTEGSTVTVRVRYGKYGS